jgi:hypothetical protein
MTPERSSRHATGPNRLWVPVLLGPPVAGLAYFLCLQLIAPQDPYCEQTAKTFPWWGGAGLNVWGAIGIGLVIATGVGTAAFSRRIGVSSRVAWTAGLAGGALAALTVTIAYLVPYLGSSCGE